MSTVTTDQDLPPSKLVEAGTLAAIALTATFTISLGYTGFALSLPEEAWIRKELVEHAVWLATLFGIAGFIELLRLARFFDIAKPRRMHGYAFVFGYSVAIIAAALSLLSIPSQMKGYQEYKAGQAVKILQERAECARKNDDDVSKASTQSAAARTLYARCLSDFEQKPKPFFGQQETPSQHCRTKRLAADAAEREYQAASKRACPPLPTK